MQHIHTQCMGAVSKKRMFVCLFLGIHHEEEEAFSNKLTVNYGDTALIDCKVSSDSRPSVKWLKKLDMMDLTGPEFNMEDGDVISVGEEHYRIIGDDENLKQVGRLDWLSQLVVKEARLEDRGMYICFVTSGGQQGFNFKQSYLSVIEGKSIGNFFFQKNLFRIF